MLTVELLVCILLLGVLCERVQAAIKYLTSIASSVSDINTQLIAFIEGACHPNDLQYDDLSLSLLNRRQLEWWSMFGRRVYQTHSSWFYEQERSEREQGKGR
jgi:hypothetical protein